MLSLLDAVAQSGRGDERSAVPIHVAAVGSDREAGGLVEAARRGIDTFIEPWTRGADREEWAARLANRVADYEPDLVVLSGFMRIVPASFVERFWPRLINTHPALLPAFPGAHAVQDALAAGVSETGASVHIVDAGMDTGPVLAQRPVAILPGDTASSLHARIKAVERSLLADLVFRVASGRTDLGLIARHGVTE